MKPRSDYFLIALGIAGLVAVYLFQDFIFLESWSLTEEGRFILRKVIRVLLNDLCMLLVLVAWFRDPKITRMALAVQVIDGVLLLPVYLFIKIRFEGTDELSMPLLSQVHRLIVNPTLMLLIIPAAYFQKFSRA